MVLEAPPESFPPYTETWNNHLAALEKLWKVASKGEKTPTVKTVTTDEFMDLVHEETVSVPHHSPIFDHTLTKVRKIT